MKRKFFIASYALIAIIGIGLMAADHIDAPNVSGTSSDITDFYAFQSPENSNNMVFCNCNARVTLTHDYCRSQF